MTAGLEPIFVTGATGFIGGRLCEALVQGGTRQVRALVHTYSHAARISRLPIQLCSGNLLDRESLREALGDAKTIIHLGLGYGSAIVRGTENLLWAARAAGVERFIHVSTAAVHGLKPSPGCEAENAPVRFTGNLYCDCKVRAERAVWRHSKSALHTVILRPSIVYGPYSRWTTRLISDLRQGRGMLIDGGRGICNAVYVDNLVDAIVLAIECERAVGESFFVTDAEAISWGDFIRAHAALMEPAPILREVTSEEIKAYHRAQGGPWVSSARATRKVLVSPQFRELLHQIPLTDRLLTWAWSRTQHLGIDAKDRLRTSIGGHTRLGNHCAFPNLDTWAIQTGTVVFRSNKAHNVIGYKPRISFVEGIRRSAQWLRFANYL